MQSLHCCVKRHKKLHAYDCIVIRSQEHRCSTHGCQICRVLPCEHLRMGIVLQQTLMNQTFAREPSARFQKPMEEFCVKLQHDLKGGWNGYLSE